MTATMFIGTLELGAIYAILGLGLYISFRILDMPDMTVDGSFVTGAAVSALLCQNNHPFWGLSIALVAGAIAGSITSLIHTKLKIQMLLAGILAMLALYSINLKVMGGKPNIPLINKTTIFTVLKDAKITNNVDIILIISILILSIISLYFFLNTKLGFALRATGNNDHMARAQAVNTDYLKLLGLAISNAFVALSGALLAQYQSFTDIGMGVGMIVIGLASIMIGEVLFGGDSSLRMLIAVSLGSIIYRFIIAFALQIGMPPTDLKLVSATIVAVALSIPALKGYLTKVRKRLAVINMKRRR